MSETLATVRGQASRLRKMIEETAADFHEEVYIRVDADEVNLLMQTNQRQVVSYSSYAAAHFDEVEGSGEAILPVGGESKGILDYLEFAEPSGTVEMRLDGEDGRATHWEAEGALNVRTRLPHSADDYNAVPWGHPKRWTPTNRYVSKSCLDEDGNLPSDPDEWATPPTTIETTAATVRDQIIEPADFADGVETRPIVVEDGEFVVRVEGTQKDDSIWGVVNAESVEGPDVNREFQVGFDEVFKALEGPVRLETAPSGDVAAPLTVVQDYSETVVVRHTIGGLA